MFRPNNIWRKYGKADVAMVNEVLCKIICHNICCLIQETHELRIDTVFSSGQLTGGFISSATRQTS